MFPDLADSGFLGERMEQNQSAEVIIGLSHISVISYVFSDLVSCLSQIVVRPKHHVQSRLARGTVKNRFVHLHRQDDCVIVEHTEFLEDEVLWQLRITKLTHAERQGIFPQSFKELC
jgi:hypothetical protein